MISFVIPVILGFTVIASVSFGILAAYVAVIGIVSAFGRAPQPEPARRPLILVPSQQPASGD